MIIPQRLNTETARDYAYRAIRDNIISIDLEPGAIVSESELAQKLGVSRTPVREALIELSKINFVIILPQRGSMISKIDYRIIEESRFIRLSIEKEIVQEACQHATPEDISKMEDILYMQKKYINHSDSDRFMELDNEFHRLLYTTARKEFVYKIIKDTGVHFDRVRRLGFSDSNLDRIVTDHEAIVEAIKMKDKEMAKRLVTKHLTRYKVDEEKIRKKYAKYLVED
ncbi:GntR family transcriptional regulator [Anaerotalea alkaliphila]|uniref:GntR family transcriptional regulator n=1 Tax=Anaerotalea alkaliphila TaxID=2662126 RepID=A0A7X5HXS1_9FIRM|nr:GntR family transcriptional regulator [Anaerotalea alkaliphila]NDL68471.1 GntR family transcriptional regulator [Anaerotalea alkaliphila]